MSDSQGPKPAKKPPKFFKAETGMFSPKEIKQVQSLGAIGCTLPEVATVFGISKATLERRMEVQPEIREALEKGRVTAKVNVRRTAYEMATNGRNPYMTRFWLTTQDGWKGDNTIAVVPAMGSGLHEEESVREVLDMSEDEVMREFEALQMEMTATGQYRLPK